MPNSVTNVGFSDYSAEQAAIDQRRQYAQALQQQSMQPIEQPQTPAGGFTPKVSPYHGLAKMLQAYSAGQGQTQALGAQKALGQKYQSDLAQTLMQAQQTGQGTPGSPMPSEELGGGPAQPQQAPDRQAMARILMGHPGTAPLGLAQMQKEMQMQSFMGAGQQGAQAPQGNPMASGGASVMAQGGGQPQAQGQPQGFGGPAGGVPMQVWMQADPTGAKYVEQLAKDHKEASTPVVNRGYGIGTMQGGRYVPDPASVEQAMGMEKGKAGIHAQYAPPHQIPTSSGQNATIFPSEQPGFVQSGQLPARFGQQPQQPQGAPLPKNVPEQDRGAYESVASGKVPAAYGPAPQQGLGTPGLSQPQSAVVEQHGQQRAASEMGEGLGKRYNSIQDAGFSANQKMQKFERLGGLLSSIETGKLTPAGTELSAWAKAAGIPIGEGLSNAQAAKALSNEMALELRNPSGGAGMPGAMSDADRNYLQSLIASIDKTPGANKLLLEGMTKLAQRDREVAKLARDYKKTNGNFDDGFYDELGKFSDANPLFKDAGKSAAGAQQFTEGMTASGPGGQKIVFRGGQWVPANGR